MNNIRAIAAGILVEVSQNGRSLNEQLPYRNGSLTAADEALLQQLCYGVCRWQIRLMHLVRPLLSKPIKDKDSDVLMLLLLGLYQLAFMRTPAHAAINETVNAVKILGKPWARGLINAILRRFQREQQQIIDKAASSAPYQHSHPVWLLNRLQAAWPDQWEKIINANNAKGPMTVRANKRKIDRQAYLAKLTQKGIAAQRCRWSSQGLTLAQPCPVMDLPAFNDGEVSIQDEAAQLAAGLLRALPGQRVLDACSAPGGKCCHILELEPEIGELWAVELNATRQEKTVATLERLQLQAKLITADVSKPDDWWDEKPFDRILIDAPCSATGVIRRHPDIKMLRRNADIDKLAEQQYKMLTRLWPLLKHEGLLVYATCSVLPEENELVVRRFLAKTGNAEAELIEADWGVAGTVGRYLLPTVNGPDGFYYATLRKTEKAG